MVDLAWAESLGQHSSNRSKSGALATVSDFVPPPSDLIVFPGLFERVSVPPGLLRSLNEHCEMLLGRCARGSREGLSCEGLPVAPFGAIPGANGGVVYRRRLWEAPTRTSKINTKALGSGTVETLLPLPEAP